ncbi:hypothetical protein T440DRAFT_556304 [Plenodomus tracheiphilus IPT5]|uniref:Uncharacterized protein n=1 Tax=Plenodomus tracheiphilus IPT5 TaxID=1408161 RepID=A0A6A7B321_9PLEO|nr:hypothetical protein T440DRAFT_556304 [Plenodomus tracheiphilus IPT5]
MYETDSKAGWNQHRIACRHPIVQYPDGKVNPPANYSSVTPTKRLKSIHNASREQRRYGDQDLLEDDGNELYSTSSPSHPKVARGPSYAPQGIYEDENAGAYIRQLATECINLRWHLEALEYRLEHDINRPYDNYYNLAESHSKLQQDHGLLASKYKDMEKSHSMLQYDHGLLAQKHDQLINIATMMCEDMQLHAKCITGLLDWKLHSTLPTPQTHPRHNSSKLISRRSPSATPVHEIRLSATTEPIPQSEAKNPEHIPLISPTSPVSTPSPPRGNASKPPGEPKLYLKLRCMRSAAHSDSGYGSVESHTGQYISPPTSASTGTADMGDVKRASKEVDAIGSADGAVKGRRQRRTCMREPKPSRKRKAEIYVGASPKRSRT